MCYDTMLKIIYVMHLARESMFGYAAGAGCNAVFSRSVD
jgi:hypothetical protein